MDFFFDFLMAALMAGAGFSLGHWRGRRRHDHKTHGVIKERLEIMRERIKIEMIFACIPDCLVITNLRGEVLFVNPPALDVLGIKNEDLKVAGRGLLEPIEPDRFRMPVQQILKNHTKSVITELRSYKSPEAPAGRYRTTVEMFPMPDNTGFGVLLMLHNVAGERRFPAGQ